MLIQPKRILIKEGAGAMLDKTGIAVSCICVAHCMVLPFAVAVLPFVGLSILVSEAAEWIIIAASVVTAALSLLPAYFRQHRRIRTLILFVSGIGFVLSSRMILEGDLVMEGLFLLTGAALISASHLINRQLCRQCVACSKGGVENQ